MNAAHGGLGWIIKPGVAVAVSFQVLQPFGCPRAQIVESSKQDRFGRTNLRACRNEPALLSVVTERAFECAAGVRQWFGATIDHAERTGDHAIAAAVANVV